jgi:hypothetical protein
LHNAASQEVHNGGSIPKGARRPSKDDFPGRHRILRFNVTRNPSAEWVVQQLREAFPEVGPYRYVILDRDSKLDATVITFLKARGLKPKRDQHSIALAKRNGGMPFAPPDV